MPTTQEDFEKALKSNDIEDFKAVLDNFDINATNEFGTTCLMAVCKDASSAEVVKLVFHKIDEIGGNSLLESQLTATNKGGATCLMHACHNSKSPEITKLVFKKVDEAGGASLLKTQLAATDKYGYTGLMCASRFSESPEVVKLLLEKIKEVGDTPMLKNQLATTNSYGYNCLMLACRHSSSAELIKLVFNKIDEGGTALLQSQITATDNSGWTCVMLACRYFSSVELIKLVFRKIIDAGGEELLKSQLSATDEEGYSCLMLVCSNSSSPQVMKLVFEKILEAGGKDLLKSQLSAMTDSGRTCLTLTCTNASSLEVIKFVLGKIVEVGGEDLLKCQLGVSHGDRTCLMYTCWNGRSKVMKLVAAVLFNFDMFKQQYEKLDNNLKKRLKEEADIEVSHAWNPFGSSWCPDVNSLVEVKEFMEEAVAAKKKAEEEAAAKKKAEEKAAVKVQSQQQQQDQQKLGVVITTSSPPPTSCFKRDVPAKNLEDSISALMSIKEAPQNRPDLKNWIPDKHDCDSLLHYLNTSLKELKDRPAIQKLIAECGLTDDDIKILHSYKIQNPFPVYLWLNGWLGGDRRDTFVKENVAPFFTLLYRAMEKLPRITTVANRAIKVNGIPALKNTFDNYEKVCAPEKILSFWGFSSFSTKSDVVNREEFVGKPAEQAIVYSCGKLEGVDMEPFAPKGLKDESEILPLCPCVLEVTTAVKMGQKLVVGVKQLDHANYSYVVPK